MADWTSDLTSNINRMTENINRQVQQFTEQLQTQIRHNVQSSLEPALAEVNRAIENLPRGNHTYSQNIWQIPMLIGISFNKDRARNILIKERHTFITLTRNSIFVANEQ